MPAMSRIATEMISPIANEPARIPACFHGEIAWRMSSVKRPMRRRGAGFGGGGDSVSTAIIATSCMIHHRAANLLTVSGPIEFGNPLLEHKTYAEYAKAMCLKLGVPAEALHAIPASPVERDRSFASALAFRQWLREHNAMDSKINIAGNAGL